MLMTTRGRQSSIAVAAISDCAEYSKDTTLAYVGKYFRRSLCYSSEYSLSLCVLRFLLIDLHLRWDLCFYYSEKRQTKISQDKGYIGQSPEETRQSFQFSSPVELYGQHLIL